MALTPEERRLATLTATVVLGDWAAFRELVSAAPPGEPDRAWREAVIQCHLFCGFPKVVEALTLLSAEEGLGRPGPEELLAEPELPERGRVLFERIYQDSVGPLTELLTERHGDFAAWILGHAYGRVLTRPGLSEDRRELLAVVSLVAAGPDRQLVSHVRGALRCGATSGELVEALEVAAGASSGPSLDAERLALAFRLARSKF